jgi:cytochrome c
MKIKILLFLAFVFVSCKNEPNNPQEENQVAQVPTIEKGLVLFQENNCASCHQPNQKVIGPSLQQIATLYKKENASIVSFLKEEADPIVDSNSYESMKINLQVTKMMTDEELQSLELYLLSHSKQHTIK